MASPQKETPGSRIPSRNLLEDLISRFLLNCPAEELQSFERFLFHVEEAHWYYIDHLVCQNPDLKLREYSLRDFTMLMFNSCNALKPYVGHVDKIYNDFRNYKSQVPTAGAIILNETYEKVLMVKGWRSSSTWGFPKGKKNRNEEDLKCAIREVYEETGLDISAHVQPNDFIERTISQQRSRLFIVPGIKEHQKLQPKAKNEISEISWFPLGLIPDGSEPSDSKRKFYLANFFMRGLKEWLLSRRLTSKTPSTDSLSITCVFSAKQANHSGPTSPEPKKVEIPARPVSPALRPAGFVTSVAVESSVDRSQSYSGDKLVKRSLFGSLPENVEEATGKGMREFTLDSSPILACLKF